MKNVFLSEWVKLRRPSVLLGSSAAMSVFVLLANFGFIRAATSTNTRGPGGGAGRQALALALSGPHASVRGLVATTSLLGIIVLGVFASNVGNEYKLGTLRFLLAGEPRRLVLMAGKFLALASLAAVAVGFAVVVGVISAVLFASLFGLSTAGWFGAAGLAAIGSTYLNVALACTAWGLIGAMLAIVLRAPTSAIVIGIAYLLVGEAIVSRAIVGSVIDVQSAWFPGEVLQVFSAGGGNQSSYLRAALLAALYVVAFAGIGLGLFQRRDVVT